MTVSRRFLLFALIVPVVGCATEDSRPPARTTSYMEKSFADMEVHLQRCTARTGYDPDNVKGVGKYRLAKNELAWRRCAYRGIERIMIPNSKFPEIYVGLIAQDKAMTKQVRRRQLTRAEREKRLAERLAEIEKTELEETLRRSPRLADDEKQRRAQQLRRSTMLLVNNTMARPTSPSPR